MGKAKIAGIILKIPFLIVVLICTQKCNRLYAKNMFKMGQGCTGWRGVYIKCGNLLRAFYNAICPIILKEPEED